jgi:hypothetical protein
MFNIQSFLKRHIRNIEEGDLNLGVIIDILEKYTNFQFKKEDLEVKNGVLSVKSSPIKKNIIFINRESILKDLKAYKIFDVR